MAFVYRVQQYNFRGVVRSGGSFDEGRSEMDDVAGALDTLCAQPAMDADRLAIIGYSFGAGVRLHHAARDSRVRWLAGIALTQEHYADPFLDADPRPKLFIAGARDAWAPADALQDYVARLSSPKALHLVPGMDHFFGRREAKIAALITDFLTARHR
jgi:alpha/beta superfamily hydrolase